MERKSLGRAAGPSPGPAEEAPRPLSGDGGPGGDARRGRHRRLHGALSCAPPTDGQGAAPCSGRPLRRPRPRSGTIKPFGGTPKLIQAARGNLQTLHVTLETAQHGAAQDAQSESDAGAAGNERCPERPGERGRESVHAGVQGPSTRGRETRGPPEGPQQLEVPGRAEKASAGEGEAEPGGGESLIPERCPQPEGQALRVRRLKRLRPRRSS